MFSCMLRYLSCFVLSLLLFGGFPPSLQAQEDSTAQVYRRPPEEIAQVVDAPFTPSILVSPDREKMAVLTRPGLPGIDEVAAPELRIAGLRINPANSGPSRSWYYDGITLRPLRGESATPIVGLPENPKVNRVRWSPDSSRLAMILTFDDRLELWAAEVESGRAARLVDRPVNAAFANPYQWVSDSQSLVAALVPRDRGPAPEESRIPTGPVIQQNLGRKAPARTYQDLLENPHDEVVFEHYATSRLVRLTIDGDAVPLGEPGLISRFSPSPDADYLLVEQHHRPFSYTVPASRFPERIEVWDMEGRVVHEVADLPLADNIPVPFGSVRTGARSVGWRADADATLAWVEALDGGDAGAEAELRDQVYTLSAPFSRVPEPLLALDHRFGGIGWSGGETALVYGWWWPTRNQKVWKLDLGEEEPAASVLMEYSWEDRYNDPGNPMERPTERGTSVLATTADGRKIFMTGDGASPEGDRPFLDLLDLETGETERLFRSEAPFYEEPVLLLDTEERLVITRRESVDIQPNYWVRDLGEDDLSQITRFPHPNPQFADVQKELIRYRRSDGVNLTATLYLPGGYEAERDGPLPMLMWAYPEEFKSADAAGQVTDSPHRFVRVTYWSPMLWLARGYAVLDDPAMPVVGEGETEPNDTFVEQLVSSARAAVDEVARRGVADPDRIAIGGHSYGAFMTANLLAHSDLFRAGIARSGAYNRTLTPFGFQSEERTLWQAPEVYFAMSPFMHADKVNEPILLIHGAADNNSGTFPLQSDRMYGALKGLGATVRLCMLPHESHGYQARESILHMLWETSRWMDEYLKEAGR